MDDLFAGRLDPLCAEFLALDVVEIDAYVLHPQPTLDGPEALPAALARQRIEQVRVRPS